MDTIFNNDNPGRGLVNSPMLQIVDKLRALGVSHPALLPQVSPHDIAPRLKG